MMIRRTVRVVLLITPLLCSGCTFWSLNPWFDKKVQVFEEGFLGRWVASDSEGDGEETEASLEVTRGPDGGYEILWTGGSGEDIEQVRLRGVLGRIDGIYYLDYLDAEPGDPFEQDGWQAWTHQIARIDFLPDSLEVRFLAKGAKDKLETISCCDDIGFHPRLAVNKTPELQEFLSTSGPDDRTWDEEAMVFTREP